MTAKHQAIAFDFDGTLVDSGPAILEGISQVLDANSIEPALTLDQGLIGPPLAAILAKVAGTNDQRLLDALTLEFIRFYDGEGCLNAQIFPGIFEMLDELVRHGRTLYLVTNKRAVPTRKMLAHLEWERLFAATYCLNEHPECSDKAQLLAKVISSNELCASTTPYVGDTEGDARSASISGMPYIQVQWGYGNLPDSIVGRICATPSDLLHILLAETAIHHAGQ